MRKGPGSAYDKWNISMVICDTDIPCIQANIVKVNLFVGSNCRDFHIHGLEH